MADSSDPPFRVEYALGVSDALKTGMARALEAGIGMAYRDAVRTVFTRLEHEADTLGEPRYDLRRAGLQVRQVVSLPVIIEYGFHAAGRWAVVRAIRFVG